MMPSKLYHAFIVAPGLSVNGFLMILPAIHHGRQRPSARRLRLPPPPSPRAVPSCTPAAGDGPTRMSPFAMNSLVWRHLLRLDLAYSTQNPSACQSHKKSTSRRRCSLNATH